MIELINKQATLIQDRLWSIAKNCYGLDRTEETTKLISAAITAEISKEAIEEGLHHLVKDAEDHHGPINGGLALSFMCAELAKRETDPNQAIELLAIAAEALGMQSIQGHLHRLGLSGPIDLTKAGQLGNTLLRGVLATGHASAMAKLRHAENYALANDAIKYWRNNISPSLSAQKAATELEKIVPLSHKKLAELVSAEKKKTSGVRRLELVRKT